MATELLDAVQRREGYVNLPAQLKKVISSTMWKDCVRHQGFKLCEPWTQEWMGSREGGAIDALAYYKGLLADHGERLSVYPHHLAAVMVGELRVTPYEFYCDMFVEVLRTERAYDVLPNWTAADCNRVLGIGRNEYIIIMNQCKSKGWLWQKRKGMIRALLPAQALTHDIDDWWVAKTKKRHPEELAQLLKAETNLPSEHASVLQRLSQNMPAGLTVGELGTDIVRGLYSRGLVWLDVPIAEV